MKRRSVHRWVVDAIEEDVVRIVEDGEQVFTLPHSLLPAGLLEGDVCAVVRDEDDAGEVRLAISTDAPAARRARGQAGASHAHALDASKKRDRGGDVRL
jgi:hypothetical protein